MALGVSLEPAVHGLGLGVYGHGLGLALTLTLAALSQSLPISGH